MKLDNYTLAELRTIAKYLDLEDFEKMKKEELKSLIFLKEVSNTMENNMIREHYQQVKYPSPYTYDLGMNVINTHQL